MCTSHSSTISGIAFHSAVSLDFNFSVLLFPGYGDEDKVACKGFGYAIACD